ncbi:MAG: carbonic anhydrase [SAR324 cluster bacterium]|nr:carbonic anhydrase [SAR324 cluster bacterium]
MISAEKALKRLQDGNRSFASGEVSNNIPTAASRNKLVASQQPFAVILGCSDSRVPAELIFNQGLGDLFVIRIAGNIVAPSQIGSVEFAVERFGTPLVVVLGHSRCGAVSATLEEIMMQTEQQSPNLKAIVERIRPAVEPLLSAKLVDNPEALTELAVRANVCASVNQLRHGSAIIEQQIQKEDLLIVGAQYSLETGVVDFFENLHQE